MNVVPLRARALTNGTALFTNETGRFFATEGECLDRFIEDRLTPDDYRFLARDGHTYEGEADLSFTAHCHGVAQRFSRAGNLDYLILVPTLRCNLTCSYCQVSRAGINQHSYDWSADTLMAVLSIIEGLNAKAVKIEFQGGEPTLRPDLIRSVIETCSAARKAEYVICTNLSSLNNQVLAILDRDDVYISTSLDGDRETHLRNRTKSAERTDTFEKNLEFVLRRYGADKISALPTVDPLHPPDADDLIDSYASRGLNSIYLRPINYHGFARKQHQESREQDQVWRSYYEAFVRKLITRNWRDRSRCLDETYLSLCLNRIFRPGMDRHVDLRNPNPIGVDYIVVDYDGQVYPTDEARMLSRSRVIDLSIGDVHEGWDTPKRQLLNSHATNELDADCSRCAYQPFCGRDVIDDLARYGRIDQPRTSTAFCKRHLHLFDFIFELIYSGDEPTLYSLRRWLGLPGDEAELGVWHE